MLSRRTRGRKINYQEEIASDSEEVKYENENEVFLRLNTKYFL